MKAKLGLILFLVAALVIIAVGCVPCDQEPVKVTGGGWFIDEATDNRISFGFTAQPTSEANWEWAGENFRNIASAKGQFQLVDHGTKKKLHCTFEEIFVEFPSSPNLISADGPLSPVGGENRWLHVEFLDTGMNGPDKGDEVLIEIFRGGVIKHVYAGELGGGNIKLHKK